MPKPEQYTMPYQLHRSTNGRDWHIDLKVTFTIRQWSENHPYGSTTAREHFVEVEVEDVEAENGQPFEPYPERNEIVKGGYISQLNESEEFYEEALTFASEQTDPMNDPQLP